MRNTKRPTIDEIIDGRAGHSSGVKTRLKAIVRVHFKTESEFVYASERKLAMIRNLGRKTFVLAREVQDICRSTPYVRRHCGRGDVAATLAYMRRKRIESFDIAELPGIVLAAMGEAGK